MTDSTDLAPVVLHILDTAQYFGPTYHENAILRHCGETEGQQSGELQLHVDVPLVVDDIQSTGHHREAQREITEGDRDLGHVSSDSPDRDWPDTDRAQDPAVQLEDVSNVSPIVGSLRRRALVACARHVRDDWDSTEDCMEARH